MGTCRVKPDAEMLAKSRKLKIGWKRLVRMLVEVPHRPLKRAKHLVTGRKKQLKALVQ
jgi:hypothetical protein